MNKLFKKVAHQDWLFLVKSSYIIRAPARFSVANFIEDFAKKYPRDNFSLHLIRFLNHYIGKALLYQQERAQHSTLDQTVGYAYLYPPSILVRFFGIH